MHNVTPHFEAHTLFFKSIKCVVLSELGPKVKVMKSFFLNGIAGMKRMENFFLKFLIIHSSWFSLVEECIINNIYMYSCHLLVKLTFGALLTLDVWVKM